MEHNLNISKIINRIQDRTGFNQTQVATQVFDKTNKALNNQIRNNKVDWDKLYAWAIKEKVDLHWLITGEERYPIPVSEVRQSLPCYKPKVDVDMLKAIIAITDKALFDEGLALETSDKAEAIALLYELYHDTGKQVEEGTVKRYLKLVS